MSTENTKFQAWLPTRPYSITDAVNRMAAATGSPRYAMAASNADYNGHRVSVCFNDYRKYWVAEYFWGERCVLGRGQMGDCLLAAKREYDRGALGASVVAVLRTQEEYDLALRLGYLPYGEEIAKAHEASYRDDRYDRVGTALRMGTTHLLIQAKDAAEYDRLLEADRASRRAPREVRP